MTPKEIRELRQAWEKLDNPPCDHISLQLARSDKGYLIGEYICTRCGVQVHTST